MLKPPTLAVGALTALLMVAVPAGVYAAEGTGADKANPNPIDTDGDGKADAWDTNGDGKADAWDTNGDGKADAWDTDADGQPDAFDRDGDGKPDQAAR